MLAPAGSRCKFVFVSKLLKSSVIVCMYKFYSRPYRSTKEAESWGTEVTQHGEEHRQGYDWPLPFRGTDPDSADASVAATAP